MDEEKQGLFDALKDSTNIPLDSPMSSDANIAEVSLSDNLDQLVDLSARILEEVQETNQLYSDYFSDNEFDEKETSAEKQALRSGDSSEVLSDMLAEIISVFADLTQAIDKMQNNQDSGGGDLFGLFGGGKKGGLKGFLSKFKNLKGSVLKSLPKLGGMAMKVGAPLAIAGGAGAFAKDTYDIASGSDGGLSGENAGGSIGSLVGAGIGIGLSGLLGLGTGGSGLLASGAIIGTSSGIGNMLGGMIGSSMDSNKSVKANMVEAQVGDGKYRTPTFKGDFYLNKLKQAESSSPDVIYPVSKPSISDFDPPETPKNNKVSSPESPDLTSTDQMEQQVKTNIPETDIAFSDTKISMDLETKAKMETLEKNELVESKIQFEELPPIDMTGDSQRQAKSPSVNPAGALSGLKTSEVPSPIYSGPAMALVAEMYV